MPQGVLAIPRLFLLKSFHPLNCLKFLSFFSSYFFFFKKGELGRRWRWCLKVCRQAFTCTHWITYGCTTKLATSISLRRQRAFSLSWLFACQSISLPLNTPGVFSSKCSNSPDMSSKLGLLGAELSLWRGELMGELWSELGGVRATIDKSRFSPFFSRSSRSITHT